MQSTSVGTVYLVGAGPGDPGLLPVRGADLLSRAGVVVHDALVGPEILERVRPSAPRIDVGKKAGRSSPRQEEINALLVRLGRRHRVVVRLKGGDPFVFGRGGEEACALQAAGIPFRIVPGVTSAVGALASAGIPLTHRGVASSVRLLTGHRAGGDAGAPPGADADETVVIFMGLGRLEAIAGDLVRAGHAPSTPAAVVSQGTLPGERVVVGTLADIARRSADAALTSPALIVVGEVVRLRERIARDGTRDRDFDLSAVADPPPAAPSLPAEAATLLREVS